MAKTMIEIPKIIWSGGEYRTKCIIGMERDGVLNEWIEHCARPEDLVPIDSGITGLVELRNKGYKIAIITDQRGVELGVMKQDQVETVNTRMLEIIGQAGCSDIEGLYFSIGNTKQDIYVKPNTGMFKRCEKEHKDIKFKEGYYVGHTIRDLKAAVNIGAKPVLVRTGKGFQTEQELKKFTYRTLSAKTLIFDNLAEFAKNLD